jgi:hypothetical protein
MRLTAYCLLAAVVASPLGGCGISFDRYDGRWVANLPPAHDCCPTRVVMDIDGHKITGQSEDCHGVLAVGGKVDAQGTARITVAGAKGTANFSGENFDGALPGDVCGRHMVGNRGG